MIIYNFILLLLLINIFLKSSIVRNIILVSFVGLATLRAPNIGIDTKEYIRVFNYLKFNDLDIEFGFKYLNKFVIFLNQNERVLFFLISFLTILFLHKFIKYFSLNYELSLLCYYCFYYFNYNFNIVRQSLALSMFGYSLMFLSKKKYIKFIFLILIASSFHYVVLTAIPLLYFQNFNFNIKKQFFLFFIFILFYLLKDKMFHFLSYIPFFLKKIDGHKIYNDTFSIKNLAIRSYLYANCVYLLSNRNVSRRMKIILKTYQYGFFLTLLSLDFGSIGIRLSLFYKTFDILLWSYFINTEGKFLFLQKIVLSFLLLQSLISVYKIPNIVPYHIY